MKLKRTGTSYMKTKNAIIAYGCETVRQTRQREQVLTNTENVICRYSQPNI